MMMANPFDEEYFNWLCEKISVNYGRYTRNTYNSLFKKLHSREFVWLVPNDDNRIQDGMGLRNAYLHELGYEDPDPYSLDVAPVSVLEVIIALSDRLAFQAGGESGKWAWRLIENLGLHKMRDPFSLNSVKSRKIDEVLDDLIWRRYEPNGMGGFFPLVDYEQDQRDVELWYQMSAYILEDVHP